MRPFVIVTLAAVLLGSAVARAGSTDGEPSWRQHTRTLAAVRVGEGAEPPRNDWELFALAIRQEGLVDSLFVVPVGRWPGEDLVRVAAVLDEAALPCRQRIDPGGDDRWQVVVIAPSAPEDREAVVDSVTSLGFRPDPPPYVTTPARFRELFAAEQAAAERSTPRPPSARAATPLREVQPVLPLGAIEPGGTDTVRVMVMVGRGGGVDEAQVVGSWVPALSAPALAAARRWRFLPAVQHGLPIRSWFEVVFPLAGGTD
jgi:TonB family protein